MENVHSHFARNTFIVTTVLAILGAFIAYLTDWMIAIPLLFGLGIPLINSHKPLKGKLSTTFFIVVGTILIFTGAVILMLNIEYTRPVLQGLVVGVAGTLILLLNGLLIKSIRLSLGSISLTFILSAISVPIGMWLTDSIPASGSSLLVDFFGQYGIMIIWMLMTTMGIAFSLHRPVNTLEK